jgi:hydrogenase maturation protease
LAKILICGVGSKLQGDDGLGPVVIEELEKLGVPEGVELADYGISGFKCALNMAHYDKIIFVDAVSLKGYEPGRLHRLRIPKDKLTGGPTLSDVSVSMHETDLPRILTTSAVLGTYPEEVIIIGCQPADTKVRLGLSSEVEKAVPALIDMVLAEVANLCK